MNQDELLARLNGFEWNDFECKRAQRGVPGEQRAGGHDGQEGAGGGHCR